MKHRHLAVWLAVLVVLGMLALGAPAAAQVTVPQSVVIIGGSTVDSSCYSGSANNMGYTYGGCLSISGTPELDTEFTFAAMMPSAVSAASLAPYDIAVLNVASNAMACDTDNLLASAKADLLDFVSGGKKLIIYDSECTPQDYSWLPFPFTTSNPGPLGQIGTLTIVEENTLSSNDPLNPYYINASALASGTDAVGDMNVMTTYDPNWSLDMSGTNYLGVTGPVHTYAKYPEGTDTGLIIYNGLDQDYHMSTAYSPWLQKIWIQELQQPVNPSDLPSGYTVVGIALTPTTAENEAGTDHTVTAKLADLLGTPQTGIEVTFEVTSGPNAGTSGTCSANADCTTDGNGEVSFTYTGAGGAGTDTIRAGFTDQEGDMVWSQNVTKVWVNQPPIADPDGPYVFPLDAGPFDGTGSTDPDGDPLTYAWDFGDSETGTGATPNHTYAQSGIYDVCLTVNDGKEDSEEVCTTAVIYDPSAGFVTGGGWIYSPVGAYEPDPILEGKATFGFVSKYKKGASTPDGNTEFQFHAAGLNFHSTGYDWLIVTGSNYAKFKGVGTVDGLGEYKFQIWAGDDDPDTFRIKIWQEISGVETVIYDNGSDQSIGGGSIVIHTKK